MHRKTFPIITLKSATKYTHAIQFQIIQSGFEKAEMKLTIINNWRLKVEPVDC